MQLILWRHASANSFNGYDRMLDPTGHKQAAQGGQWLATRDGREFFAVLSQVLSEAAGQSVRINPL